MPRTEAQMLTLISLKLADTANATFGTGEIREHMTWGLRELAQFIPYKRIEQLPIESRHGTASSTLANNLVDATLGQFLSTDADKVIYNIHDKTWAIVTGFSSTAQVSLSQDIMASGEGYKMFNRYCRSDREIDLSLVDDWVSVEGAEYPYGRKRNVDILDGGRVLQMEYGGWVNDTRLASSTSYKDALVHLNTIHRLPAMTDYAGAVNNSAGYAIATTSIAVDALGGTEVIPQHSLFTIASVRGVYRTTAAVTLAASATTALPFYPPLFDAAVDNDVVTFVQSTLTPELEEVLADMVVVKSIEEKPISKINSVTIGRDVWQRYLTLAERKRVDVERRLRRLTPRRQTMTYPRT